LPAAHALEKSLIKGVVKDQEGRAISDTVVQFTGEMGGPSVTSDKNGKFSQRFFEMGTYNWSVKSNDMVIYAVKLRVKGPMGLTVLDDTVMVQEDQVLPPLDVRPDHIIELDITLIKKDVLTKQAQTVTINAAKGLYLEAEEAYRSKDFELAREKINRCLEKDPESAYGYYLLGVLEYDTGQQDAAHSAFVKALELDPQLKYGAFYLGQIAVSQAKVEEAIAWFEKELIISPDMSAVYQNLGAIYRDRGELAKAATMFEGLLTLEPNDPDVYSELIFIYEKLGNADKVAALLAARDKLGVQGAQDYHNLGVGYWQNKQFEKATEAFNKALAIDPNLAAAHKGLGYCLIQAKSNKEAKDHLLRYLELTPDASDALKIRKLIVDLSQ